VLAHVEAVALLLFGYAQPDRRIDHFADDQAADARPHECGQRRGDLLHDLLAHRYAFRVPPAKPLARTGVGMAMSSE
jgi:hypothetical protein